jgi:Family of unknown function (DUF5677)/Domain of unknown function (DUF4279)
MTKTEASADSKAFATLRFAGDALDPAEISAVLRVAPTRAHGKGEEFVAGPRAGTLHGRTGMWFLATDKLVRSDDLQDHLQFIEKLLYPAPGDTGRIAALRAILERTHSRARVTCFWRGDPGEPAPQIPDWFKSVAKRLAANIETDFEEGIDSVTAKAIEYGQRLLNAAIDLVGEAKVELDNQWGRHPHVVALTLLCRSICNFRASLRLVQDSQVVEARALVRLLYENVLWLNMVKLRGAELVEEMRQDEITNRKSLAQLSMKLAGSHGADVDAPDALKLRSILKELRTNNPAAKRLETQAVAADGGLEMIYFEYKKFSLDAVHCSVTALGRHLYGEHRDGHSELTLSVIPNTPLEEVINTIMHANYALLCAAVGANDLVRCESSNSVLSGLWKEFEANGWQP